MEANETIFFKVSIITVSAVLAMVVVHLLLRWVGGP